MPDAALALPLLAVALAVATGPVISAVGALVLMAGAEALSGYFNPLIAALVVGPWLLGRLLRSRRQLLVQLRTRGDELAAEEDLFAAESVRFERARIARELHDIVAHCMSVVVVQAGAARRAGDPTMTAEALAAIAATSAQAREEMNRLVSLLDTTSEPRTDAGLAVVTELVERARATGLSISVRFTGVADPVPSPVADAVHRVVQEAVTNALKHAPGAPIQVAIDSRPDVLQVSVLNGPAPACVGVLHMLGGAHGLAGMHERATRCGGNLEAGPRPDGGWRVTMTVPAKAEPP